MARFFIDRPVFAMVLAILITLLGAIAGFSLPIAQYPNITKPRISVGRKCPDGRRICCAGNRTEGKRRRKYAGYEFYQYCYRRIQLERTV